MNRKFLPIAVCVALHVLLNNVGIQAQLNLDQIELQKQLPEELLKSNFTLNDAKDVFRKKCKEVAGEEAGGRAFEDIESGLGVLSDCVNGIVNYTTMQQEIEEASPEGELDVVFNKYCNKRSSAIECFDVFTAKLSPCLDKEEQESKDVIKRIIQSLLNFVCHKDGDQIALFIAEKGPECLESEKDNIQKCLNSTFSTYLNSADIHDNKIKSIPKLTVGQRQCDDMLSLQSCVVHRLEQCTDITPANLVESMFNFIRNETLCRNYQKSPLTAAAASSSQGIRAKPILYSLSPMFILMFALRKSA